MCLSTRQHYQFTSRDFMFFELPEEVLFSVPLRYLFAIGSQHSYLALDGQHHPYSASTPKLTYSLETARREAGTAWVVYNAQCHRRSSCCCRTRPFGAAPLDYSSPPPEGGWDSVSGWSLFARSYWGNPYWFLFHR